MAIILSVALLFLGIVALVFIHVWVVSRAFRRGLHEFGVTTDRTNLGNTSMSRDDVEKLPCFDFKPKDQSPADCAVCLDRFKAGEKCRLLPLCRHSFHAECIDVWLLRAPICPICRARADNITAIAISGETVVAIELRDTTIENPVEGHAQLDLELLQREDNPGLSGTIGMAQSEEQVEGSSISTQLGQVNLDLSGCSMEKSEQQESVESSCGNELRERKITVEGEGMVSREIPGTDCCQCSINNSNQVQV